MNKPLKYGVAALATAAALSSCATKKEIASYNANEFYSKPELSHNVELYKQKVETSNDIVPAEEFEKNAYTAGVVEFYRLQDGKLEKVDELKIPYSDVNNYYVSYIQGVLGKSIGGKDAVYTISSMPSSQEVYITVVQNNNNTAEVYVVPINEESDKKINVSYETMSATRSALTSGAFGAGIGNVPGALVGFVVGGAYGAYSFNKQYKNIKEKLSLNSINFTYKGDPPTPVELYDIVRTAISKNQESLKLGNFNPSHTVYVGVEDKIIGFSSEDKFNVSFKDGYLTFITGTYDNGVVETLRDAALAYVIGYLIKDVLIDTGGSNPPSQQEEVPSFGGGSGSNTGGPVINP